MDFEETRCEVIGIVTDQGAEAVMRDRSQNAVPFLRDSYSSVDPRSDLWPVASFIAGHLHMLFNALGEASKALGCAQLVFDALKTVCVCDS